MTDQRAWRKSRYSGANENCVEVSLPHWRKSSHGRSGGPENCVEVSRRNWHTSSYTTDEGACVEVAEGPVTGIRDSKNRDLGALFFPAAEWAAFVRAARQEQI